MNRFLTHILFIKKTLVTIKGIPCPNKNVFKFARDIHIILFILINLSLIVYVFQYYPLIKYIQKVFQLPSFLNIIVTFIVTFTIALSTTFLNLIKIEVSYIFLHIQYQIKILNKLIKQLLNGLDDNDMDLFQRQISKRLIKCIELDNHIRR